MSFGLVDEILAASTAGYWVWSTGTGFTASPEVHAGVTKGSAGPEPVPIVDSLVHPADRPGVRHAIHVGLRSPTGYDITHRCRNDNGTVRLVRSRGRGVLDSDGVLILAGGSVQDVTELTAVAAELTRARDVSAGGLPVAADRLIIGLDLRGWVTLFDSGAQRILGYRAEDVLGGPVPPEMYDLNEFQQLADELHEPSRWAAFLGAAAAGELHTRQWTFITRAGHRLHIWTTVSALLDADGQISGYIASGVIPPTSPTPPAPTTSDVFGALFETYFDQAPHGMMLCDASVRGQARILRANTALSRLTGFPSQRLTGMAVADLTHPDHRPLAQELLHRFSDNLSTVEDIERRWVHATGRQIWVHLHVVRVRTTGGMLTMATIDDITARRDTEHDLRYAATHDQLTGLPNRYLLSDRLHQALAARHRNHRQLGVLFVDLDGFKTVNDTHGHAAGDEVLRIVAGRLEQHMRAGDTVARFGGDEFIVLCPNLSAPAAAAHLARRLRTALNRAMHTRAGPIHLTASIGAVLSDTHSTTRSVLDHADTAMYRAKHAGKDQIHIEFDHEPS